MKQRRWWSWKRAVFAAGVLAFVGGAMAYLRSPTAWEQACTLARRNLPGLLGMEVGISRCELDPLGRSVRLYGIYATPPGAEEPVFSAESAEVTLSAFQWLLGPVRLDSIELVRPRVSLDFNRPPRPGPPRPPGEAKGSSCPLSALSHVRIDRLALKGAELRVRLPEGRGAELLGVDVGWKMRRGVAQVEVEGRQGTVELGPEKGALALGRLSLQAGLDADDATLELGRAEVALDDVTLSVSGRIDQLCDPTLALDGQLFVPVRTLAKAAGGKAHASGHLWAGLSASGRAREPNLTLDLVGTAIVIGAYHPGDFKGRLTLAGNELRVTDFAIGVGGGRIRATAAITLAPTLPIKLRADADEAELAPALEKLGLTGAWVNFPASGHGTATGRLAPFQLNGEADLKLGRFQLATRPWDAPASQGRQILTFAQGRVQTAVKVVPDHIELSNLQLSSGASHFNGNANLNFDTSRGLSVQGRIEPLDLADYGEIASFPVAGNGRLDVSVVGPYADVKIDALASLRDLDFWDYSAGVVQGRVDYARDVLRFPALTGQKGKTGYSGSVEVMFGGKATRTKLDLKVPAGGRTEDLIDAIVRLHPSIELFQGPLLGEAGGTVKLDTLSGGVDGAVELAFHHTTYYGRPLGEGGMRLRFHDGQKVVLEHFNLAGPVGRLRGEGTYDFDGPVDYRYSGEGLSLAEVVGAERAKALGVGGELTLRGKVEGDSAVPVATAYLTSPRVTWSNRSMGEMHLEGKIEGRQAQFWGRPFDHANAFLRMKLRDPVPYEATLSLALPEIRPLLPEGAVAQGVTGTLAGKLSVSGMARDLRTTKLSATLDSFTLARADFEAANDGPIILGYQGGRLQIDRLSIRGPNTAVALDGWISDDSLDMRLRGGADMRLFESFLPQLERTGGRLELTGAANGLLENPSFFGNAHLRDVRLSVRDQTATVRQLSADVEFSDERVVLQELTGVLNDGRIGLRGDVLLDRFKIKEVDVGAQLDEVSFRPTDDLPLTTSGELKLFGRPTAMVLSGELDVLKLRYEKALELEQWVRDFVNARPSFGGGPGSVPRKWLGLDVGITLGDVRIENNLARAQLVGKLRLVGSNVSPGLLGTVEAPAGGQLVFRGNRFQISQGLMDFRSRTAIDPLFDLHAEAAIREYQIRLHAFGKLDDPKLVLTAEPALAEADILSLLTLGVTSKDSTAGAQAQTTGGWLAAEALFSASGLDRQVQRFLPKTTLLRDLSFHISTAYNDASGLVEPATQLESKFLFEQLKLSVTRPVSGRGTRAQAEYRLDNGISAQAQWDNEQSESSIGNLGVDLKLRWELK